MPLLEPGIPLKFYLPTFHTVPVYHHHHQVTIRRCVRQCARARIGVVSWSSVCPGETVGAHNGVTDQRSDGREDGREGWGAQTDRRRARRRRNHLPPQANIITPLPEKEGKHCSRYTLTRARGTAARCLREFWAKSNQTHREIKYNWCSMFSKCHEQN